MTSALKALAVGVSVGIVLAVAAMGSFQKAEIVRLKAYGDSVTSAAHARDSGATAQADSARAFVDSVQSTKRKTQAILVATRASRDSLRRALEAGLGSAHDTIVNQASQIVAQDSIIAGLETDAKADSISLWVAMRRGDRLLDALHAQTAALSVMNARIQSLDAHALPKWLRVSFDVAQKALAVKELADIARGNP